MAKNESHANTAKEPISNSIPQEFAAMGKKQFEELVATQNGLMAKLQDTNKIWLDRMQSKATLASEFSAKLTAARSMPDVAMAYQEWGHRHMEMAADDTKRMIADAQKLAETGARLLFNGWRPNGHGGST